MESIYSSAQNPALSLACAKADSSSWSGTDWNSNKNYSGNSDGFFRGSEPPSGHQRRPWIIPVIIAAAIILVAAAIFITYQLTQPRVYKYYTVTIDSASLSDDDLLGYLGSGIAGAVIDALLDDCYIELEFGRNATILLPEIGYSTFSSNDMDIHSDNFDVSMRKNYLYIRTGSVTVVFERLTKAELEIYEQLLSKTREVPTEQIINRIFNAID